MPWLVWLSWFRVIPQSERSPGHGTCLGCVLVPGQGVYEKQPIDTPFSYQCFSPSFSPSLSFSKSESIKSLKKEYKKWDIPSIKEDWELIFLRQLVKLSGEASLLILCPLKCRPHLCMLFEVPIFPKSPTSFTHDYTFMQNILFPKQNFHLFSMTDSS